MIGHRKITKNHIAFNIKLINLVDEGQVVGHFTI